MKAVKQVKQGKKGKEIFAVPMKVVRLIRKVEKHILAEPRRFDIFIYTQRNPRIICGTTACIAGWIAVLDKNMKTKKGYYTLPRMAGHQIHEFAAEKLGLPTPNAKNDFVRKRGVTYSDHLFYVDDWPHQFRSQYYRIDEHHPDGEKEAALANLAVARLEHFVHTGK